MDFLQQLDCALEYIEENLSGNITFDKAAKIACCSTYNFQRMFSYITGVPLSEYIRRRRMTAAAFDLQDDRAKISEVAEKYGYNSPTAFNRAFRSVHGIAPSAVWGREAFLITYPRLRLHVSVTGDAGIKYRIEVKKPLCIVGVRLQLTADLERNFTLIPEFWQRTRNSNILPKLTGLMNQSPHGLIGATVYERPDDIGYIIGAASDMPAPEGMLEYNIPEMTWAVFQCTGPMPSAFQELYRRFYSEWLPVSDYINADGPELEVYMEDNITSPSYTCELWMPILKK